MSPGASPHTAPGFGRDEGAALGAAGLLGQSATDGGAARYKHLLSTILRPLWARQGLAPSQANVWVQPCLASPSLRRGHPGSGLTAASLHAAAVTRVPSSGRDTRRTAVGLLERPRLTARVSANKPTCTGMGWGVVSTVLFEGEQFSQQQVPEDQDHSQAEAPSGWKGGELAEGLRGPCLRQHFEFGGCKRGDRAATCPTQPDPGGQGRGSWFRSQSRFQGLAVGGGLVGLPEEVAFP